MSPLSSRAEPSDGRGTARVVALLAGPVAAVALWLLVPTGPDGLGPAGVATLALMAWMAIWWITEAADVAVTALLPVVVLPLAGAATAKDAAAPYASPFIFLFAGGFLIALGIQRWSLDRRLAMSLIRLVGTSPRRMVGAFMISTALLSAFVSNTATAAMMLPLALSLIALVDAAPDTPRVQRVHFAKCLLLGTAYAASIGGIMTIIGSPPNVFTAQFLADQYDLEITFLTWMRMAIPITVVMLPLCWLLLTRVVFPLDDVHLAGGRALVRDELRRLGPMRRGEWTMMAVFGATALAWILQPQLARWNITDPVIAMTGGLLLFILPVEPRRGVFALDWSATRDLPWGTLILFGGGLSLAAAARANGVTEFIGERLTEVLSGAPEIVVVAVVVAAVIFLTELTSNTATTAALVPILAAGGASLGVDPIPLVIAATLAASFAFMMPVATPPNAIVFASRRITVAEMCRAGIWLNALGIVVITIATWTTVRWVLG